MGLSEWWSGGKEVKKANATADRLQERKAQRELKPWEESRLEKATATTRRHFLKQITAVLGGATVFGAAIKSITLANNLPPLELNGFRFVFDKEFSKEEYKKIINIFEKATPVIMEYLPEQKNAGKEIKVKKIIDGHSGGSYPSGTLIINPTSTDGLMVHELTHLFHGKKDCISDFVEEGLAVAISILVTRKLGMTTWGDNIEDLQINDALENGGLSVLGNVSFRQYQPLSDLRYMMSSRFWLEFEKAHPGFIKQYHEYHYKFLEEGGDKRRFALELYLTSAKEIAPEVFDKIARGNPMMRFNPKPKDYVYVRYEHVKDKDSKRGILINIVSKGTDGAETPYRNERVDFKFMNMDNGVSSQDLLAYTDEQGAIGIDLNKILEKEVGKSSRYKIIYTVRGKTEEFEFTY